MKTLIIAIILALAGCAITPRESAPAVYDLGGVQQSYDIARQQSQINTLNLEITDITSSVWLDSSAIHYRLAYHNPARLYIYTKSRWAGAPAALLTQRIRNRVLVDADDRLINTKLNTQQKYILKIELQEFTQTFDTSDKSHAVISMQASLIERHSKSTLAKRNFRVQQVAPTADAAGAVHALIKACDQLIGHLIDWIVAELADEEILN